MGIFRSESMQHGTLVLPVARARDLIDLILVSMVSYDSPYVLYCP